MKTGCGLVIYTVFYPKGSNFLARAGTGHLQGIYPMSNHFLARAGTGCLQGIPPNG